MIRLVGGISSERQAGSALFYALLFAAIVSIAVSQVIRMTEQSQAVTKGDELKSSRDKLRRRLQTIASIDDAVLKSYLTPVGMNDALRQCLKRVPDTAVCAARTPGQMTRFALYSAEGQLLTSSGDAPVLYDKRGNACADPTKCVFEATSYFWTVCHDPADINCPNPETLYTLVQVRMIAGAPITPALAPVPRDTDIFGASPESVRKWASHMAIDQVISSNRTSECQPGEAPVLTTGGSVKCQKISDTGVCGIGTLFTGVNSLGQPRCQPIGKLGCVSNQRVGTHTCTDGGCKQDTNLNFKCEGSLTGRPRRLVYLRPNAQACRTVSYPSKKKGMPDGIGTQICTTVYDFTCCE